MRALAQAAFMYVIGGLSAYLVWVGKVDTGQYTQWKTTGQWAVIDGDNSRLRVQWHKETREFVLDLEASAEHAATDGQIPTMYFNGGGAANRVYVMPRFTN